MARQKFKLFFRLTSLFGVLIMIYFQNWVFKVPKRLVRTWRCGFERKYEQEHHHETQSGCRIPSLDPFHPSMLKFFKNKSPRPLVCENERFPLLFTSTLSPPTLVPLVSNPEKKKIKSCCYRNVHRTDDETISLSEECKSLSFEEATLMPEGWEFVGIECDFQEGWNDIVDLHPFFYPGDPIKEPKDRHKAQRLNAMILEVDSTSRMSFIRYFAEVRDYLLNNLSALEMQGYHKIGENTFPNLVPMLINRLTHEVDDFAASVDCERDSYVDECPFIWKAYKSAGYSTLFAEDEASMPVFNLQSVYFKDPPTDHYFQTFGAAAEKYIAHEKRYLSSLCYGPRSAFQVMLDYMEKMALFMDMERTPFFQVGLSASVTHELVGGGRLIAGNLLGFLQRLQQQRILNNTVLILMSDHGSRLGSVRNTLQGFLEDRFPALYIVVPPWFESRYGAAYRNIKQNTKRLITTLDIHQTLENILYIDEVEDGVRQKENQLSPGTSLFLPIPEDRTCQTAGIPSVYCTCYMHGSPVSENATIVKKGAALGVEHVNALLSSFPSCACLKLKRIVHADRMEVSAAYSRPGVSKDTETAGVLQMYRIVFETSPGAARFEGLLDISSHWKWNGNCGEEDIKVRTVARINLYKNQSWCVGRAYKPFCFCQN